MAELPLDQQRNPFCIKDLRGTQKDEMGYWMTQMIRRNFATETGIFES
jgi:hypothetical protein